MSDENNQVPTGNAMHSSYKPTRWTNLSENPVGVSPPVQNRRDQGQVPHF